MIWSRSPHRRGDEAAAEFERPHQRIRRPRVGLQSLSSPVDRGTSHTQGRLSTAALIMDRPDVGFFLNSHADLAVAGPRDEVSNGGTLPQACVLF